MGLQFLSVTGTGLPADADFLSGFVRMQIAGRDRLALVLDHDGSARGFLFAVASRSLFSPVALATELAFWIDPPFRGRSARPLIDAYTDWAREMGCCQASISALPGKSPEKLYARAGFKPAEITYSKVL